jgi:hypothetical protein
MATVEVSNDIAELIADLAQRMGMPPQDVVEQAVLEFAEDYVNPRDMEDLVRRRESGDVTVWAAEVRARLGPGRH